MLTDAQAATLKADIYANTDQYVQDQITGGSDAGLQWWYSQPCTTPFYVWKSTISVTDIFSAVVWAGTGGLIARSQGERDAFAILTARGAIDPSKANIRQGIADIFSGASQAATDTRTNILAIAVRNARNIEKLFATGTGTQAVPANLVWEGPIGINDIYQARTS